MTDFNKKIDSLKKDISKRDISTNLSEPDDFVSTGNLSLNYAITGDFFKGIPNRRLSMLAGTSGSGKSFLLGNIAKESQDSGRFVVYIDTENAIDKDFLENIGVSFDEDKFLPMRLTTLEELSHVISNLFKNIDGEDKLTIILDSFSMISLEDEEKGFSNKGELAEDRGREAKKKKQFLKNINSKIGDKDFIFLTSSHTYVNQNALNGKGDYVVSGGEAQLFIPSLTIIFNKLKLKEDSEAKGIRMKYEILKNRMRPSMGFKGETQVRFEEGMKEHYGLLDLFENMGLVHKKGPWKSYINSDGEEVKFQNKDFENIYKDILKVYNPTQHSVLDYVAPSIEQEEEENRIEEE